MGFYIGIDGGGTKTEFLMSDGEGKIIARLIEKGTSYQQYGFEETAGRLEQGVNKCLSAGGVTMEEVAGIFMGLPCVGESASGDAELKKSIYKVLPEDKVRIGNDVEAGYAGALGTASGIHLVAGTGSIGLGKNREGRMARCGGWHEYFSDEGSCCWLGRKTMELFTKEADGRCERGRLYEVLRREFSLGSDFDWVSEMINGYLYKREKIASLQIYLMQAALDGDGCAKELYSQAAEELMLIARGIKRKLGMERAVISYSGGLFKAGGLILGPLQKLAEEDGDTLAEPKASPAEGALLLARQVGVFAQETNNQEERRCI